MKNGILIGAAFGMAIGALLVNNNRRVREMVSDTQERVKEKVRQGKDAMTQNNCCCSSNARSNGETQNSGFENTQSDYMN